MSPRTTFLSRLIGLSWLFGTTAMIVHRQATVDMMAAILHNPAVLFLSGACTLVAGLAIVLSHNVWEGGAAPVIVTVVGWIALVKGLVSLYLSPETHQAYFEALHYGQYIYLYSSVGIVLGAYLTYAGFRPASR
jgi:hypothetical protein